MEIGIYQKWTATSEKFQYLRDVNTLQVSRIPVRNLPFICCKIKSIQIKLKKTKITTSKQCATTESTSDGGN